MGLQGEPIKYKDIGTNLEDGVKQLGNQIRSMPHIIIGKNDDKPKLMLDPQEQAKVDRIKKWALIVCVSLVAGYAALRILKTVL